MWNMFLEFLGTINFSNTDILSFSDILIFVFNNILLILFVHEVFSFFKYFISVFSNASKTERR